MHSGHALNKERGYVTTAGKDGSRDTYTSRALDIAEIKTLMLVKEVDPKELQRGLDKKGVEKLEDLDALTIRNFRQYPRSLWRGF